MSTNRRRAWRMIAGLLILFAGAACVHRAGPKAAVRRALDAGLARVEQAIASACAQRIAAAHARR